MSSNVGLNTPRGSGTSGYVQRNSAHLKLRDSIEPYPKDPTSIKHRQRQPDKDILEHERKREIEVKVFELRNTLEEEEGGLEEDEIEAQCAARRKELEAQQGRSSMAGPGARSFKSHQVHEIAKAKIEESERLRRALGISKEYEEGNHWRRQEESKKGMERESGKAAQRRHKE